MSERLEERFPAPDPEDDWDQDGEVLPLIDRETYYDLLMEQQEQM